MPQNTKSWEWKGRFQPVDPLFFWAFHVVETALEHQFEHLADIAKSET
jgi:hypothetical protein